MSDQAKKFEEELRLRLLAVTEDPTFQGGRTDGIWVFGGMQISGGDDPSSVETVCDAEGYLH
jgi:hypothetical protein